tara:strand:+ start:1089 stop:1334 length:246 start_codon:yes stop_codon:yes gene_type:complete
MTELSTNFLVKLPEETAKDPLVRKIAERMINRSNSGIIKYGDTMVTTKMDLKKALNNTIEELLDAAVYLERAVAEIDKDAT